MGYERGIWHFEIGEIVWVMDNYGLIGSWVKKVFDIVEMADCNFTY